MTRASIRTVRGNGRKPRPVFCSACGGKKHRAVPAANGIMNDGSTLYAFECQSCFVVGWL